MSYGTLEVYSYNLIGAESHIDYLFHKLQLGRKFHLGSFDSVHLDKITRDDDHNFSWRKYDMLWEYDKDETIIQFASKKPQLSDYEAQFDFYSVIINKIELEQRVSLICCVK